MPAIMTHDFFGRDVYDACFKSIGFTADDRDAFLLGNQGPDPLLYIILDRKLRPYTHLSTMMHTRHPSTLLVSMKNSVSELSPEDQAIGRAYAAGFLCHYLLDSTLHPFVYAEEYAYCDAGVEGLDRSVGGYVHAEIERDLDEMVLYSKLHRTVATYKPYQEILRLDEVALSAISHMYVATILETYNKAIPEKLYQKAVHDFRRIQHLLYSQRGQKAQLLGNIEELFTKKPYSIDVALSHRPRASETSEFDNRDHKAWRNPFTKQISHDSFVDLYDEAYSRACDDIDKYLSDGFDETAAEGLTGGLNFSGEPAKEQ